MCNFFCVSLFGFLKPPKTQQKEKRRKNNRFPSNQQKQKTKARAAQRKSANTYRVSANRKAFFANFRRFTSISGQSTRRRTPKRRDQGRMSRTSLEPAHTEEVLCVTDEAYSAQTAQYQAQRRGIAHLYFLSFFLHMRRGNYGSGHSASTSSCKIARF